MINFKVDQEKCTKCKSCVMDCPVLIINGKSEFPEIKEGKEGNCIKCQHCLAVCPEAAISILGKSPENSILTSSEIPTAKTLENLMQTRRSIRRFKKNEIDRELIHHMITKASYAPTPKNENAVQFTVVDNKEDMKAFKELTYNSLKKANEEGRILKSKQHLANFQSLWESKNIDILFRNAPHVLITSTPKTCTTPLVGCTIATTYFDLLANSNGIGSLWDGFATDVIQNVTPEIKASLGIPEDHIVGMVLAFGTAATKYSRSIQNDAPNIKRITF